MAKGIGWRTRRRRKRGTWDRRHTHRRATVSGKAGERECRFRLRWPKSTVREVEVTWKWFDVDPRPANQSEEAEWEEGYISRSNIKFSFDAETAAECPCTPSTRPIHLPGVNKKNHPVSKATTKRYDNTTEPSGLQANKPMYRERDENRKKGKSPDRRRNKGCAGKKKKKYKQAMTEQSSHQRCRNE